MNILDNCKLTDDEADLAIYLVNGFGHGDHPAADEASIYFFTPNYVLETIEVALEHDDLVSIQKRIEAIAALKTKLEAHQTTLSA